MKIFTLLEVAIKGMWSAIISVMRGWARIFGFLPPSNTSADAPIPDPAADIRARLEGLDEQEGFVPPAAGAAVHAYASAGDSCQRSLVDLSALTAEQVLWLTGLGIADLERLAKVGVRGCEKAASGRKCGVVGLPFPGTKDSKHRILVKDSQADAAAAYRYAPGRALAA